MIIKKQSKNAPKTNKIATKKKKKVLDYSWIDTLKKDEKDAVIMFYDRIFKENNIEVDINEALQAEKNKH